MEERLERLLHRIESILIEREQCAPKTELYTALALAQSEMDDYRMSGENCHYKDKYATLGDLVRMSRPALSKHGLCVFQDIYRDGETDILRTTLAHQSGQTISSEMRITPSKNTLHVMGSYIAYLRRVSYSSLIGLLVHDRDDDDANMAMQEIITKKEKGLDPALTSEDTSLEEFKRMSKAQVVELEKAMGTHYDLGQEILSKYGVSGLSELPAQRYEFLLVQLRKNVALREGNLV